MSVNPLFGGPSQSSLPGTSRGGNNVLRQTNLNAGNWNHRGGGGASSLRPRKKLRTAGDPTMSESDPFQDFDSFTEDDLETFDMIASQALSQQPRSADDGPPDQALRRPTSTPRFQRHPSSASFAAPVPFAQTANQTNASATTQAFSGYSSYQHSNSLGASGAGRFTFSASGALGRQAQAPVASAVSAAQQAPPTSTISTAQGRTVPTRQSNVSGTKIYYSSQYRTGSTSPGGHQQAESLDSVRAQSLHASRSTGMQRNALQANAGPKATAVKSESRPGSTTTSVNSIVDGFCADVDAQSDAQLSCGRSVAQPLRGNSREALYSGPSQGGGRSSTASLTPPKGAVARESPGLPTSDKGRGSASQQVPPTLQQQQVSKYKTESDTAKQELTRLTKDMITKEGEIQVLRQNLGKVNTEVSRLHAERVQAEQLKKEQIDGLERALRKEIESLQTRLHFQEAELMQAHSASQSQQRSSRPPVPAPQAAGPVTPPRQATLPCTSSSTSASATPALSSNGSSSRPQADPGDPNTFPTQQTFMADNPQLAAADRGPLRSPRLRTFPEGQGSRSSPRRSPKMSKSRSIQSPAAMSTSSSSSVLHGKPPYNTKKCLISSRLCKTSSKDAQLVGSLLQDRDLRVGSSVAGLIGLVQRSGSDGSSPDLRETGKEELNTPVKPKRVLLPENSVTNQSVELTTRAISSILHPPRVPPLPPNAASGSVLCPSSGPSGDRAESESYVTDLLPLLEDQLALYMDTARSISQSNAAALCSTCPSSSSSSSAGSRSRDCSMDSTGSASPGEESLSLSRAEAAALSALTLLRRLLVCSPPVRTAVLRGSAPRDSEPAGSDGDVSAMEIDPSAPLIDPTQWPSKPSSRSSTVQGVSCPRTNGLLSRLMRLAGLQHGLGSVGAVRESALSCLWVLVRKSSRQEDRLQSLLVHDALYLSLSHEASFTQACHALDILTALASSSKLTSKYCNQSDSCLLLQCYRSGVHGPLGCSAPQKIQLTLKAVAVLWRIIGSHHQGAALLVDTDCRCSMELLNAVVLMTRKVLQVTMAIASRQHPTIYWRHALQRCVLLLHCLAMADRHFTDHHPRVEKVYVATVTALSKLYHTLPDVTDNEGCLVQDLWDLIQCDEAEWEAEEEEEEDEQPVGEVKMEVDN